MVAPREVPSLIGLVSRVKEVGPIYLPILFVLKVILFIDICQAHDSETSEDCSRNSQAKRDANISELIGDGELRVLVLFHGQCNNRSDRPDERGHAYVTWNEILIYI